MEYIVVLCILIVGVLGQHHHIVMHDCYGHRCYSDEKPYCRIHSTTSGSCQSISHCSKLCGTLENGHDCCCYNQECVNVFLHNKSSHRYTPGPEIVHLHNLLCYVSHDLRHHDMDLIPCTHDGDVCMFHKHSDGRMEAKCISEHECDHARGSQHHHAHIDCCYHNNCTYQAGLPYQKHKSTTIQPQTTHTTTIKPTTTASTATPHLLCYVSQDLRHYDMDLIPCTHDGDVCMFHKHSDGRMEAKCISEHECDHARGSQHHHAHIDCCYHNNCTYQAGLPYQKHKSTTIQPQTTHTTTNKPTTTASAATPRHIDCYNCMDVTKCDNVLQTCNLDEVCMFYGNGSVVEVHCRKKNDCEHMIQQHELNEYTACCTEDNCRISLMNLLNTQVTNVSTTAPINPTTNFSQSPRVRCNHCNDFANCKHKQMHLCHHDEVCMFQRHNFTVKINCQKKQECFRIKNETGANTTDCCDDHDCVHRLKTYYRQGEFATFPCKHCYDLLNDDCGQNSRCHVNEVCMIRHIDQRVETRCVEKELCEERHRHDMQDPSRFSICCGDEDCSRNAYNQSKHVNVQNETTEGVCRDTNNTPFRCSDYVKDFDICNQKAGTGLLLATTRCKRTCGFCPGQVTPSGVPTIVPYVSSAENLNTTQLNQSSSNITTVSSTSPPCVDHDDKNICDAYGFYFCAAIDGQAREFAVINCAKTCNLCNEYYGYVDTPPPVTSTQTIHANDVV